MNKEVRQCPPKEKSDFIKHLEEIGFVVQVKDLHMPGDAGTTSFTAEYVQRIGNARELTLVLRASEGPGVIIANVSLEDREADLSSDPLTDRQKQAYLAKVFPGYKKALSQALGRNDLLRKVVESPLGKLTVVVDEGQGSLQTSPVVFPEFSVVGELPAYQRIVKILDDAKVQKMIKKALASFILENNDLMTIVSEYELETANRMVFEARSAIEKARELIDKTVNWGYPDNLKLLNIIDDLVKPLEDLHPELARLYKELKQ